MWRARYTRRMLLDTLAHHKWQVDVYYPRPKPHVYFVCADIADRGAISVAILRSVGASLIGAWAAATGSRVDSWAARQ